MKDYQLYDIAKKKVVAESNEELELEIIKEQKYHSDDNYVICDRTSEILKK